MTNQCEKDAEIYRRSLPKLSVCGWVVSEKSQFYYSKTMICDDVVSQESIGETWKIYEKREVLNKWYNNHRNIIAKSFQNWAKIH